MFGIGMPELLVILAVALIVIGPKKLPDLARSLGKALGEFRRATNDIKQSIEKETGLDDVRNTIRQAGKVSGQPSDPIKKTPDKTDGKATAQPRPSGDAAPAEAAPSSRDNSPDEDQSPRSPTDSPSPKENGTP